jgi:hypothetical protein
MEFLSRPDLAAHHSNGSFVMANAFPTPLRGWTAEGGCPHKNCSARARMGVILNAAAFQAE